MAHAIIFTDQAPQVDLLNFKSPYYSYTAGAYKIASVLRNKGLDALVIPNCLSFSYSGITEIINKNSANLLWVGVSLTFCTTKTSTDNLNQYITEWNKSKSSTIDLNPLLEKNSNVKEIYQRNQLVWNVKELSRIAYFLEKQFSVPLIIGGANTEEIHQHVLKSQNLYQISGYAEKFALDLTESLLADKKSSVPFMSNNTDYDNVEFKKSSIVWNSHDLIEPNDWLPLEVSRGCAFDCAYCNYSRKSSFDSYKDPESLRQELIYNYEHFGVTKYILIDDLYNDSKNKVRELYDKTWSRLPFRPEWVSYMRLDMIWSDPESAEFIKASGARCGSFGIETLHDQAGRKIGKGLGKTKILETLQMLKTVWNDDVLIAAFFLAGLPFEPLESIKETIKWCADTDLLHGYSFTPIAFVPPTYIKNNKNRIDSDFDKFGIRWIDDHDWINSVGVTRDQTVELMSYSPPQHIIKKHFTFVDYTDLRMAGFSHEKIANIRNGSIQQPELDLGGNVFFRKVQNRLDKILKISL